MNENKFEKLLDICIRCGILNTTKKEVYNMYEEIILNNADPENQTDECSNCPFKGSKCNNQCMEIH